MQAVSTQDVVKYSVIRMIVVAAVTAAFGFAFFRQSVLNMRTPASQFLTSGVTAAVFYAGLRLPRLRDGLAALLVWYCVLTFVVGQGGARLMAYYGIYVVCIAAGVYLYVSFVRREIVRGALQRIASAGVITGVANALIEIFLGLMSLRIVLASLGFFASTVFRNLQIGTLVGIAFGIGAEIAEYAVKKLDRGTA